MIFRHDPPKMLEQMPRSKHNNGSTEMIILIDKTVLTPRIYAPNTSGSSRQWFVRVGSDVREPLSRYAPIRPKHH